MPKIFRPLVGGAALCSLLFLATGCRTTATKLASVPGFSWLESDEETWAGYEPAPGLPLPSESESPTGAGAADVSSIAKGSTPVNPALAKASQYPKDSGRFDPKYLQAGSSTRDPLKKDAAGMGDYASAYGKYGPPQQPAATAEPQQGPYSVAAAPNYAAGLSANREPVAPPVGGPAASTQGFAANQGFTPGNPAAATTPAPAASRGSRFGGGPSQLVAGSPSTYTPPGFITKPKPATPPTSRFDSFNTPAANPRAPELVASNAPPTAAGDRFSAGGPAATASNDFRASRFGAPSTPTTPSTAGSVPAVTSPSAAAGSSLDRAVEALTGGLEVDRGGRFGAPASTPRPTSPSLQGLGREAAGAIAESARTTATEVSASASSFGNRFQNVTQETAREAVSVAGQQASRYLDAVRSPAPAATPQTPAGSPFGNPPAAAAAAAAASAPSGPKYPSTNTPKGYLDSLTPAATRSPAPSSTPSTIQRSSAPFRPGSTTNFQSSRHTANKQAVQLASASSRDRDAELVLAVGDKFQFPRTLR